MFRLNTLPLSCSALNLAFGAMFVFTSCGKVNDMHDATMKMSETTKRMENVTCTMYRSLRQGNAKASRNSDLNDINHAKDITDKLAIAAEYMQGFEYQVWSPACVDESPRNQAIEQAVRELLTKTEVYAKNRSKVTATKQSSNYETLYALAATLHYTNALQENFLLGSNEKVMRPLDILIEGIQYDQALNRGEISLKQIPSWAITVGKYEKDAEFLLRLRANFLMAYAYAVADSDDFGDSPSTLKKLWRVVTSKLSSTKWSPNLEKRSPTEIRERIIIALKLAIETRKSLIDLGIDPLTDKTVLGIWENADFSIYNLDAMKKNDGDEPARAETIRELIAVRDQLISF